MIVEKFEPSDDVKTILRTVIAFHKQQWSEVPDAATSFVDFNNQKIPKGNRDVCPMNNFILTSPLLYNVKEMLGADEITNNTMYPKNSFMGWHTNADTVGQRVYINFSITPGIFRYIDPSTGEVVDDYDNEMWTGRKFIVSKDAPLWHTVWAPERRFAFGFNIKM